MCFKSDTHLNIRGHLLDVRSARTIGLAVLAESFLIRHEEIARSRRIKVNCKDRSFLTCCGTYDGSMLVRKRCDDSCFLYELNEALYCATSSLDYKTCAFKQAPKDEQVSVALTLFLNHFLLSLPT